MCRILTFAKHFQALSCIDTRALGCPEVERPYQPLSWGSQKPGSLSCCLPNSHIQPMSRSHPFFLLHTSRTFSHHPIATITTPCQSPWLPFPHDHSGVLTGQPTSILVSYAPSRQFFLFFFFFTSKMKIWSCSSVISDTSGVFHLRLRWQLNPSLWLTRLCRGLSPPASAGFALTVLLLSLDLSAVLEFL